MKKNNDILLICYYKDEQRQLPDLPLFRRGIEGEALKDVQVLSSEETLNILPELNDQTIANDEE